MPNEFGSHEACRSFFDKRVAPAEKTVFRVQNVTISQFAFEEDHDFHLVLLPGRPIFGRSPGYVFSDRLAPESILQSPRNHRLVTSDGRY